MVTDWNIEQPISPRQALIRVGSTAVVGVLIGGVYALTGWGIPCPFRWATGWLCPFCGGTHLAVSLLHGDLLGAWAANPLVLLVSGAVGVRTLGWLVELVRAPRSPSRRWLPTAWRRHGFAIFAVVSVLYVLARNLLHLG